jgi:hypothetical protein
MLLQSSLSTTTVLSLHNPHKVNQDAYITSPHFLGLDIAISSQYVMVTANMGEKLVLF